MTQSNESVSEAGREYERGELQVLVDAAAAVKVWAEAGEYDRAENCLEDVERAVRHLRFAWEPE